MRIAFLATGFSKASKEATKITLLNLAQEMIQKGHAVTIITENQKKNPEFEKEEGIEIYRTSYGKLFSYPLCLKKVQKVKKQKFDVIHGFSAAPILILRSLLAKYFFCRKAKIVHTLKSYSKSRWGNRFFPILQLADQVTIPTKMFATKLTNSGVKEEKISLIFSPINDHKFYPQNIEKKQKLRESLGFSGKKVIFYYGATWKDKGFGDLLCAFQKMLKIRDDLLLVAAPRYTLEQVHLDNIKNLGISQQVRIVTEKIDVEDYLSAADLCVLPYRSLIGTEGNPSCLLEAMASKIPVVTTTIPEIKEIAQECVLMAEPKNVSSVAETINLALNNYPPEMIEKAYLKSKEFSNEKITESFLRIYESI